MATEDLPETMFRTKDFDDSTDEQLTPVTFTPLEDEDDEPDCCYCGDTGWVWVNAVECVHCDEGRKLAGRDPGVITGGLDATIPVVEVD